MAKTNDLLNELDATFEAATAKNEALVAVQRTAATALAEATAKRDGAVAEAQEKLANVQALHQSLIDEIQATHQAKIAEATTEAQAARTALSIVQRAVNERVGSLTGSAKGWSQAQ